MLARMLLQRHPFDGRHPSLAQGLHPGGHALRMAEDAAASRVDQVGAADGRVSISGLQPGLARAEHRHGTDHLDTGDHWLQYRTRRGDHADKRRAEEPALRAGDPLVHRSYNGPTTGSEGQGDTPVRRCHEADPRRPSIPPRNGSSEMTLATPVPRRRAFLLRELPRGPLSKTA